MPITNPWYDIKKFHPPASPGVYELGDTGSAIRYIGRSSDLMQRITDHRNAPPGAGITQFRFEITSTHVARERELFEEYKRWHGGQIPPYNDQDPSASR